MEEQPRSEEEQAAEKMAGCYRLAQARLEELAETGTLASRRGYFLGKLEVYKRMLANLPRAEEGLDCFFMGSLWKDILHSTRG